MTGGRRTGGAGQPRNQLVAIEAVADHRRRPVLEPRSRRRRLARRVRDRLRHPRCPGEEPAPPRSCTSASIEIAGRTMIWAERLVLDDNDPKRCREMIASLTMSIINQIERHELGRIERTREPHAIPLVPGWPLLFADHGPAVDPPGAASLSGRRSNSTRISFRPWSELRAPCSSNGCSWRGATSTSWRNPRTWLAGRSGSIRNTPWRIACWGSLCWVAGPTRPARRPTIAPNVSIQCIRTRWRSMASC